MLDCSCALRAKRLDGRVWVATDDERISNAVLKDAELAARPGRETSSECLTGKTGV